MCYKTEKKKLSAKNCYIYIFLSAVVFNINKEGKI